MAVGGPETPFALADPGLDIEAAMASANAPGNAVIGTTDASVPTRQAPRVPPVGMGQLQLGVDAPLFAWQPSQQDLGQGEVQHIRSGNFVTPVAERQLPFGAIASRNQATALRRQELEANKRKAAAAFDPFKDIRDPAAQHNRSFSNYLKNDYQRFLKENADARFGGDMAQVNDWVINDPQGQAALKMWGKTMDSVAAESAGMTDRALDMLAKYQAGEIELDAEDYNKLVKGLNNADDTGAPQLGVDVEEFRRDLRNIEGVMSKAQFTQQFLRGFDDFAEHAFSQGRAQRIGPGRYAIRAEDKLIFDDYKEAKAEEAVALGMFDRDLNKARAHFDKLIKDRVDVKLQDWSPPTSSSSGDGDKPKAPTVVASVAERPAAASKGAVRGPQAELRLTPYQQTGDKMHKVAKMNVTTGGRSQDLYAPSLTYDEATNDWRLSGVSLSETEKAEFRNKIADLSRQGTSDVDVVTDIIMTSNMGKPFSTSIRENGDAMEVYWGTRDPYEVVAKQLQGQGYDATADRLREDFKDKFKRKKLIEAMR